MKRFFLTIMLLLSGLWVCSAQAASGAPQDVQDLAKRVDQCSAIISTNDDNGAQEKSESLKCSLIPCSYSALYKKYKDQPAVLKTLKTIDTGKFPEPYYCPKE